MLLTGVAALTAQFVALPPFDITEVPLSNIALAGGDTANSGEELPGLGHKFELYYAMQDGQDPQNLPNDVISLTDNHRLPCRYRCRAAQTPAWNESLGADAPTPTEVLFSLAPVAAALLGSSL